MTDTITPERAAELLALPFPGEKAHTYFPDYRAGGDCRVCGHTYGVHVKAIESLNRAAPELLTLARQQHDRIAALEAEVARLTDKLEQNDSNDRAAGYFD